MILVAIGAVAYGLYRQDARTYTDPAGKFSVMIPEGWAFQDVVHATSSSMTWFVGPKQDNGDALMRMAITRFDRTPESNAEMKKYTEEGFFQLTANNIKLSLNKYNETANETVMMKDRKYYRIAGTYVGLKSQKEVTQELYVTLTDDAYYVIGIDVYSKIWEQQKGYVLTSLDSFTII
ncbi:MAG: hypothetical protein RLY66_524 [Candidatus Parcubacteria bacterium]